MFFWLAILAVIISFILVKPLLNFLSNAGFVAKNYKGMEIPTGTGILWIWVFFICLAIIGVYSIYTDDNSYFPMEFYVLAVLITGALFLGFADDRSSRTSERGFGAHLKALFKGRLTTGFIKAAGGIVIATVIALSLSDSLHLLIVNSLIIALFMNAVNLLDTRPGRALISFLVLYVIIIGSVLLVEKTVLDATWNLWGVFLAPAIVLIRSELRGESMLGDAGSNMLGAVLGYMTVASFGTEVKTAVLIALAVFNIFADRVSITKLLEKSRAG